MALQGWILYLTDKSLGAGEKYLLMYKWTNKL